MLQEGGDLPDAVVHLADADELAGEHDAEVDLATAQADAPAAGRADGAVVEGILRLFRQLIFPR